MCVDMRRCRHTQMYDGTQQELLSCPLKWLISQLDSIPPEVEAMYDECSLKSPEFKVLLSLFGKICETVPTAHVMFMLSTRVTAWSLELIQNLTEASVNLFLTTENILPKQFEVYFLESEYILSISSAYSTWVPQTEGNDIQSISSFITCQRVIVESIDFLWQAIQDFVCSPDHPSINPHNHPTNTLPFNYPLQNWNSKEHRELLLYLVRS